MKAVQYLFVLMITGLCGMTSALAEPSTGAIEVVDPYVRAVPPVSRNSAMFMQLQNSGDKAIALVSAASPAAQVVELHTHTNDNGVMRMRRVPEIEIPAGQTTVLQPGGLHVMLIGLQQKLEVGGEVEVRLEFDDGSTRTLVAPIRAVKGMGMKHKHHHHHH